LGFCFGAAVRLDDPNHHVYSLTLESTSFLKHFVRLAHARREAEINLETTALLLADESEEPLCGRGRRRFIR
jgi:hypothetical protein